MKYPENLTIAVVGFAPIVASSLKSMIAEVIAVPKVVIYSAGTPETELDKADIYIVEPEAFIFRLDYFMPRRQRTAVATRQTVEGIESTVTVIPAESSVEQFHHIVSRMAHNLVPAEEESSQLTTRELDVLRHIAQGKTNKEIADSLVISVNTVITHRKNLSRKLGIRSASGLSLYAVMNGIV